MLDKEIIKENFSRSAWDYDQHALLQRKIADELCLLFPKRNYTRILDMGCGTGYLTARLATTFPLAEVVGVDLAPGMVEVAKQKYNLVNLRFVTGDAEYLNFLPNSFDLVVSNASLQWMNYEKVFAQARKIMDQNGIFCFSTFGPMTLWELKIIGFRVNRFASFESILNALKDFEIISGYSRIVEENFKNVKDLVYYLKEIGASFSHEKKRKFDSFSALKNYREKFGTKASFETIFFCVSRRKN